MFWGLFISFLISCETADNTLYPVEYPYLTSRGYNILGDSLDTATVSVQYSMAADLKGGSNIKVTIEGGVWGFEVMPDAPENWKSGDFENYNQEFWSDKDGEDCDLTFEFIGIEGPEDMLITINMYENQVDTISRTKQVYVKVS